MIEDSVFGVEAARRCGMPCVAVARKGDADDLRASGAMLVLDRLDRVQPDELLERLERRR